MNATAGLTGDNVSQTKEAFLRLTGGLVSTRIDKATKKKLICKGKGGIKKEGRETVSG